jgi:hypothetical protein
MDQVLILLILLSMNQESSRTKQELMRTVRDKISFVIMFSVINKKIK